MENIQKFVAEFVEKAGVETSVEFRLLDLVSEMGELSKEVLKGTNYGKRVFVA